MSENDRISVLRFYHCSGIDLGTLECVILDCRDVLTEYMDKGSIPHDVAADLLQDVERSLEILRKIPRMQSNLPPS